MNEPDKQTGLLKELTRRRVFRSAGAYIVFAWLTIQVGDIVFPQFGAPAWAMRALIIVFIAGFPPAMLLAWTLDISTQGIKRTPESGYSKTRGAMAKFGMALVATAMSAGVLWWMWDDYILQSGERVTRSGIKEQPVIAVQAPRQLAGKTDNEWLGDGIANLVRSELAESQHAVVISQTRWSALTAAAADDEETSQIARSIGVDYLIDGELFETPRGIVLTMHVEDVDTGIQLVSPRASGETAADIIGSIPTLGIEIKQALRIPHQERVGLFEADFAIDNIEAYETYIAGLAYLIDFEYQDAERAFNTVLSIAPDYHIARFRLAQLYETTGRAELARSTLDAIPDDANLSRRLQLYIDGAKAYFIAEQDPQKAIEIYSELVELYPYEMEAGTLLAEAYWLNYQDAEAIAEFRRMADIHPYDPTAWMALGERLLDEGELGDARDALTKYASMMPEDAYALALLGKLDMLQGRLDASIANHEQSLQLKPGFVVARLGLARSHFLRGHDEAAEKLWRSVVADEEVTAAYRIDAAFDLAGVLRGRGLFEGSLEPLNDAMPLIREEQLRLAMALSESGTAHLELGNLERAEALLDESIREAPGTATRYLFARGLFELRLGRFERLALTIAQTRELAGDDEDTASVEANAANYLAGLAAMEQGRFEDAEAMLRAAVDGSDYQYAIYRLGLAELLGQTGDLEPALLLARLAATERDPGDLRLDLELDRARALLLYAELLSDSGADDQASASARAFIDRWRDAGAERPEMVRAQRIVDAASGSQAAK